MLTSTSDTIGMTQTPSLRKGLTNKLYGSRSCGLARQGHRCSLPQSLEAAANDRRVGDRRLEVARTRALPGAEEPAEVSGAREEDPKLGNALSQLWATLERREGRER